VGGKTGEPVAGTYKVHASKGYLLEVTPATGPSKGSTLRYAMGIEKGTLNLYQYADPKDMQYAPIIVQEKP
jgi:hypothetical protein